MDLIDDQSNQQPDEAYLTKNKKILYDCLNKLSAREKYIVCKRQALDCDKRETLEVIGERFGVTRERIRQIEISPLRQN